MKTSGKRLIFALKDGQPVHISAVERGLACGCVCPACGERLVAKKGMKMVHHFAHSSGTECEHGFETSLHLAAKEILSKAGNIFVPCVYMEIETDYEGLSRPITKGPIEIIIDHVELEKRIDSVIPDIIIYSGTKQLLVEIYVTHRVDDKKRNKIKQLGLSAIEIDMHNMSATPSLAELEECLVNETDNKRWINNEFANTFRERLLSVAERKPIIKRGMAYHVDNCPIKARIWHGRYYANVRHDCEECKYRLPSDGKSVLCSGNVRVSEYEDLKIPLDERIKREDNIYYKRFIKKAFSEIQIGICPVCGEELCEEQYENRIVWKCTNFDRCRFFAKSDPETGEITINPAILPDFKLLEIQKEE